MRMHLAFLLLAPLMAAEQIDPKIYAKLFSNNQPIFDAMSTAVLQRLPPSGSSVLDISSGPGEPTLTLAKMDRDRPGSSPKIAQIVCTDYQEAMKQKAQTRVEAAGPFHQLEMVFETTSGDNLDKWHAEEFDAVTMSYGLMFIPDKQKSLQEVYRVLKPGGFAYISVWKALSFQTFAHEVMNELAGEDLGEFAINPMALKEENAVEKFAKHAALQIVKDDRLNYSFKLGSLRDTADSLTILAGEQLKKLEAKNKDAKTKYYNIVEREVKKRGWYDASADTVALPSNVPQLLILRKPLHEEL